MLKYRIVLLCLLGFSLMFSGIPVSAAETTSDSVTSPGVLRVLIFSGKNNHNWKKTTPALKKIYEDSGRFVADVTNDPSGCTAETFAKYDAIVSNWTNFPSQKREWGESTEKAFLNFIRNGKGFVLFHAASACYNKWPEYQQLIGSTWGPKTGHGPYHKFNVTITDKDNPITKGLKDFSITDELWHRIATQPKIHVLCKAFSAKDKGGTGNLEPAAHCSAYGKGRSFNLVLGHDTRTMQNKNWKLLMLRGTEWAATNKVTIKNSR